MRSVEKCTIGVGWNSRKSCLLFVSPWWNERTFTSGRLCYRDEKGVRSRW